MATSPGNGPTGGEATDQGFGIVATEDGGALVLAETDSSGAGERDLYLVRIDRNGDEIWARTYGGAGTEWASARPRAGFVSWVAFDPTNADRVYATYATFGGKHVWTSADGGARWRQIDGNGPRRLPNIPVHSILADPADPDRLFVGTDLGVFVSTWGGLRWAVENTGFSNTVTEALQINTGSDGKTRLYAFTHGRGAWRVEIGDP